MRKHWYQLVSTVLTVGALALTTTATAGFNFGKCCDDSCDQDDCCDDARFSVHADVLFWEPCQHLTTSYRSTATLAATAAVNGQATVVNNHIDNDWDVGFRLNGAYRSGCSGWDANIAYTYFTGEGSGSQSQATAAITPPVAINLTALVMTMRGLNDIVTNNGVAASFTSKHELDYYTLDALVGYRCCVCDSLELRPFAGFRGVWIDQQSSNNLPVANIAAYVLNGSLTEFDFLQLPVLDATATRKGQFGKTEYEGFGLHGGLEFNFTPECSPVSIFGKAAVSAVVGDFDYKATIEGGAGGAAPLAPVIVQRFTDSTACTANFGADLQAGVRYDHCLCGWNLHLATGYEMTHWLNADNAFGGQALTLHGAFLRFGAEF